MEDQARQIQISYQVKNWQNIAQRLCVRLGVFLKCIFILSRCCGFDVETTVFLAQVI